MDTENDRAARLLSDLRATCTEAGFDLVQPLQVGWYNVQVEGNLKLFDFGSPAHLGIVIGNTRALWARFTAALRADPALLLAEHPLQTYTERTLTAAVARLAVPVSLRWSHSGGAGLVAMQRLAQAAGLAYIAESQLSVHAEYGPWISLRAALSCALPGPSGPAPRSLIRAAPVPQAAAPHSRGPVQACAARRTRAMCKRSGSSGSRVGMLARRGALIGLGRHRFVTTISKIAMSCAARFSKEPSEMMPDQPSRPGVVVPLPEASFRRADFGRDFQLGVATSSYQIEGAVAEGGRAPSIWDRFTHTPGKIKDGSTGDVACDHYHRLNEDVDFLAWLGVNAYRFSIAWPRVMPQGTGAVNSQGLDFYERLVDALLARGIAPCVTLYHWDLPDALEAKGGWLQRSTAEAFAEYSAVVAARLGDRVALWLTHNEPWCQAFLGYELGLFAPGRTELGEAILCAHHLLLSHGLAVQALRSRVHAPIGIAPNFMPAHPASRAPADLAAAARQDAYFNRWFIEPVLGRGYPRELAATCAPFLPKSLERDLAIISQPIDVVGVNYYERCIVQHDDAGGWLKLRHIKTSDRPRTADREIYPEGLSEVLERLHGQYAIRRIVITENGAATKADEVIVDGRVHDTTRVEFLRQHLEQVLRARGRGVPVQGYFAWSLMDNFEWSEGYTLRYGIVHVDFETQRRTPKDSAYFLRAVCGKT